MKPYTDLMIDLETLDVGFNAVILQIGWCFFDRDRVDRAVHSQGWYPDLDEQMKMGRSISLDTINWWHQQDGYDSQMAASRQFMDEIIHEMTGLWNGAADMNTHVWAKGTSFDIGIWRTMLPEYWDFRKVHDLRTLKLVGERMGVIAKQPNADPHDAVSDAETQAMEVQAICSILKRGT